MTSAIVPPPTMPQRWVDAHCHYWTPETHSWLRGIRSAGPQPKPRTALTDTIFTADFHPIAKRHLVEDAQRNLGAGGGGRPGGGEAHDDDDSAAAAAAAAVPPLKSVYVQAEWQANGEDPIEARKKRASLVGPLCFVY